MYVALCLAKSDNPRVPCFRVTRRKVMDHSRISSIATYHKKINELEAWGYIKYAPSFHPINGSAIMLLPEKLSHMPASIITPEDLQTFKKELLEDIKKLMSQQTVATDRKWLKSQEVRKLLGLSPGTLQNLRVKGVLPFTKIGGIMYYNYEDIKKMLEGSNSKKRALY
jgi:hypothetical protein